MQNAVAGIPGRANCGSYRNEMGGTVYETNPLIPIP
jgi:hypothetical protein